jgi:hypothetical protein
MKSSLKRRFRSAGSLLIEVSAAMALTAALALIIMRASLLAVSGNQWTIMQTLTDAYLSREIALSNRIPIAELIGPQSTWPEFTSNSVFARTVTLGKLAGGQVVEGSLKRFRTSDAGFNSETQIKAWRLHSVLSYNIGGREYVKSRSTLRLE